MQKVRINRDQIRINCPFEVICVLFSTIFIDY